MTKLWIMSDIHDDYSRASLGNFAPPQDVEADVLVIAGDVAGRLSKMGFSWLSAQINRLDMPIVVVPGNHDFWRASIDREVARFRERNPYADLHVLDGDAVTIAGVRFVGGTLWTDYRVWHDDAWRGMREALRNMNDFGHIRTGTDNVRKRLTPPDLLDVHIRHREAIKRVLATRFDGPTVVVTHHAPSPKSLRDGRVTEPLDAAYASDLEDLILAGRPDLWIHGHVHRRRDYWIGDTRILCNPRGYRHAAHRRLRVETEVEDFDERLVVEVGPGMRPRIVDEVDDDEIQQILAEHGIESAGDSSDDIMRAMHAEFDDNDEHHFSLPRLF